MCIRDSVLPGAVTNVDAPASDSASAGPLRHINTIIPAGLQNAFIDASTGKHFINHFNLQRNHIIIETAASYIDPADRGGPNGSDVNITIPDRYPLNDVTFKDLSEIVNIKCFFYAKKYITHDSITTELTIQKTTGAPVPNPFSLYNVIIVFKLDEIPLILNCIIDRGGNIIAFTSFIVLAIHFLIILDPDSESVISI